MKLVDISDLGSDEFVRGGSSPSIRKMKKKNVKVFMQKFFRECFMGV